MKILTPKDTNCRNCFKCISHCPVKAISYSGNQAHIIADECILCGKCFVVCPQNAKEISSELWRVKEMLRSGEPVFVTLAPSFVANYENVGIGEMRFALTQLGFAGVEETAIGATIVKNEYDRILREEGRDIVISSSCPSVNLLVQKYFPRQLKHLADVMSPMLAHCLQIKESTPGAKCVFIGPCIAKKDEAEQHRDIVDAVLTFDELSEWLREEGVDLDHEAKKIEKSRARLFPTTGGILETMSCDAEGYTYIAVDGVEDCMDALRDIEAGLLHGCFIEMSACKGSCVNGPVMAKNDRSLVRDCKTIRDYAGQEDFYAVLGDRASVKKTFSPIDIKAPQPTEAEIDEILRRIGIMKKEDELDCGACGYNTCREKAAAIFCGKSEESTCLPYLKDKAENLSQTIVKNSPNGIIVISENFEIQQINREARKILNIRSASDVIGSPLSAVLDPAPFEEVMRSGEGIIRDREYLPEYEKYVVRSVIHDREDNLLICFMRDITEQEREREKKEAISRNTVEVADKVVERQMRIVQEIASLLGETAAETKIALTKLKESMTDE